jgi:hypothetical protein
VIGGVRYLAAMMPAVVIMALMRPPEPNPGLSPQEVVRIQLEALKNNNVPQKDTGIRIAFLFASPENQAFTGPFEHFSGILKNPTYSPLLDHQSAILSTPRIHGDKATERVTVKDMYGSRIVYVFYLARQRTGAYSGCWLTDGVVRQEPSVLAVA